MLNKTGVSNKIILFLIIFMSSILAYAEKMPAAQYEIWSGAGYINYFTGTDGASFYPTKSEKDSLLQSEMKNNAGYFLGVNKKVKAMSVGMMVRYDPTTFSGEVYQYDEPGENAYKYQYSVAPISVMLESSFFFLKIKKWHLSSFIITGIGLTKVKLTYNEVAQKSLPADSAKTVTDWQTTPDFAIGAGLRWDLRKNYFVNLQYLYQYRGDISAEGNSLVQGVPVNLNEGSVDFIVGYRFA
ncbi:MAG: hypothetical protein NTZ67_04995 [Gammaproteobacteria bacterium]|nr:hypothetical protein [Gammaproteobacteria bacterium]